MDITTTVDLTNPERESLRTMFGCADDVALEAKLGEVSRAALQEHLDMFLGMGSFTRGSDFQEHRLAILIPTRRDRGLAHVQVQKAGEPCADPRGHVEEIRFGSRRR